MLEQKTLGERKQGLFCQLDHLSEEMLLYMCNSQLSLIQRVHACVYVCARIMFSTVCSVLNTAIIIVGILLLLPSPDALNVSGA